MINGLLGNLAKHKEMGVGKIKGGPYSKDFSIWGLHWGPAFLETGST